MDNKQLLQAEDEGKVKILSSEPAESPAQHLNPTIKPKKRKIPIKTIIFLVLAGLVWLTKPYVYKEIRVSKAKNALRAFEQKYGINQKFSLGNSYECITETPTNFGDITKLNVCYVSVSKLYYINTSSNEIAPDRSSYGSVAEDAGLTVYNFKAASKGLFSNASPAQYLYEKVGGIWLQTGSYGFFEKYDKTYPFAQIDGVWKGVEDGGTPPRLLRPSKASFYTEGAAGNFKQAVDTLRQDRVVVKGAIRPSEALKQQNIPFVVTIETRTCHAPNIIILDNFCILPN